MKKLHSQIFTYFIIFTGNLILRLSVIFKGVYHRDALEIIENSKKLIETHHLIHIYGTRYPLVSLLGSLFIRIGRVLRIEDPIIMTNFMNVLLSSVSALLLYALCNKMFDRKSAVLSAILFSLHPLVLFTSVYTNSHWTSIFFMLLGFLFLVHSLSYPKNIRWLIVSGICFGLMGGARLYDLALVFIPVLLLFFNKESNFPHNPPFALKFILFIIFTCAVFVLFYQPLLTDNNPIVSGGITLSYLNSHTLEAIKQYSIARLQNHIIFQFQYMTWIGFLALIFGLLMLYTRNKLLCVFFTLIIFTPIIAGGGLYYVKPRHFLPSITMSAIVQGFFWANFMKKKPMIHNTAIVIGIIFLCMNAIFVLEHLKYHHDHDLMGDYYKWIATKTKPDDYIIERHHGKLLRYYSNRNYFKEPNIDFDLHKEEFLKAYQKLIDNELKKGSNIYITSLAFHRYPRELNFKKFIKANYELIHLGSRPTISWYSETIKPLILESHLYKLDIRK